MSSYANYTGRNQFYDAARVAVGLEVVVGELWRAFGDTLSDQRLLYLGCGTGIYLKHLAPLFKTSIGIDASASMLEKAQKRMLHEKSTLLLNATVPPIPDELPSPDVIFVNQMSHHLSPNDDFSEFRKLLFDCSRRISSNGVLILGTSSPEQILQSYWFSKLLPIASCAMSEQFPTIDWVIRKLSVAGFRNPRLSIPTDLMYDPSQYFDFDRMRSPDWRKCDSMFDLASSDEIDSAIDSLSDVEFMRSTIEHAEESRLRIGQCLFITARKK